LGFFSRRDKDGYDKKGYDKDGYGRDGYDRDGYDKDGYGRGVYDRDGYDRDGYDRDGYDRDGFNASGIHKITGTRHNSDGYDVYGIQVFNGDGFLEKNSAEWNEVGINRDGTFNEFRCVNCSYQTLDRGEALKHKKDQSHNLLHKSQYYNHKISPRHPQLIVILIDQSSSMNEYFFSADGKDYSFANFARRATDSFLLDILRYSFNRYANDTVYLAIMGYGSTTMSATPKIPMEQLPFSVTKLAENYIKKNEPDDGDTERYSDPLGYHMDGEIAIGLPSLVDALEKTKEITEKWITNYPDSVPPVILNITNGLPADDPALSEKVQRGSSGDLPTLPLAAIADEIKKLATTDGNVLLCNALLGAGNPFTRPPLYSGTMYPTNVQNIDNSFAEPLFEMSSVIPGAVLERFISTGLIIERPIEMGSPVKLGSRLFFYNSDINSLLNILIFQPGGVVDKRLFPGFI